MKNKRYDYLVVGSGLSGAVIANKLHESGKKVLVIEKRSHVGGNCYTEDSYDNDIQIQKYGAHIFRTSKREIWDYVNRFTEMLPFKHKVMVYYIDKMYSFPINLMTLQQVYNRPFNPFSAGEFLQQKVMKYRNDPAYVEDNLENHCIKLIGPELYEIFIKGYTEKQWGTECKNLPSSIIKRIPVRFNYNDTYFDSTKIFEGQPKYGYTEIFNNMLEGIEVWHKHDYNSNREYYNSLADKVIYTGPIDELYNCEELEWRSLDFKTHLYEDIDDYQGVPVINHTNELTDYTRVIEHKHFYPWITDTKNSTVITHEFPADWKPGMEKYYPIPTERNFEIVRKLTKRAEKDGIILVGRLAEYKYFDMDDAIINAFDALSKMGY